MINGLNYTIVEIFKNYQELAIFLGSFFFAESVILTASFLAGQGFWPLLTVFWYVLLGDLLSDCFWYFGGLYFLKITHQWLLYKNTFNKILEVFDKITRRKPFLALLFIKFLYGTRFLMLIYVVVKGVKFKTFLFYDILGTLLWLLVIIPIGWLAGRGTYNLIPIYKNISYSIPILFISFIMFKITGSWLKSKIINKKNE